MPRVLILTNSLGGLYNFRKELIQKLLEQKYEVIIASPKNDKMSYFTTIGCNFIETPINRRGINPISDLKLLYSYIKIIKDNNPNVVLSYTIKPNVYGGLACRLLRVSYITNITGLGTSIENKGILQKVSLMLYRLGMKKAKCVFFQNESNKHFFTKNNITTGKTRLIPGSGVNLEDHRFEIYPNEDGPIKLLFIGRTMKAKGIDELLKAAKKVRENYPNVEFNLVGRSEEDYSQLLRELETKKIIKYHGQQNDVHSFIKNSHAIINPSHHEGMSNVLLESASTGRPIIASNIPGCRETFDQNVSGIGFEARNVDSLVDSIIRFVELPHRDKEKMGIAGRKKVENEFDRNLVIDAYIDEIKNSIKK